MNFFFFLCVHTRGTKGHCTAFYTVLCLRIPDTCVETFSDFVPGGPNSFMSSILVIQYMKYVNHAFKAECTTKLGKNSKKTQRTNLYKMIKRRSIVKPFILFKS